MVVTIDYRAVEVPLNARMLSGECQGLPAVEFGSVPLVSLDCVSC